MLALTRKAEYAVLAMAELARRGPVRLSAREIARCTRVPLPTLTNVLHQLLLHGLVTSALGSKGGYQLARTPEDVTFTDMIDAVEGPLRLTACCATNGGSGNGRHQCHWAGTCPISDSMRCVHEGLHLLLDRVTLARVAAGTVPAGLGLQAEYQRPNGRSRRRRSVPGP